MISTCELAKVVFIWMDYLCIFKQYTNYMLYKANNKEMIRAHIDITDPWTRADT